MYSIYEVEYGDTLYSILNKFNISSSFLNQLNGKISNIYPGMKIIVPNNNSPFIRYVVEKGDNVYSISKKYGVNYKDILLINNLDESDYIYPNQEILILKDGYNLYLTKENDSINKIITDLNINIDNLLNNNSNIYLIPNQLLIYKKEKTM